jgi:hypothetical protein
MLTHKNRNSPEAMPLLFACFIALTMVSTATCISSMSLCFPTEAQQPIARIQPELDTHWRYTRFGWQDSSFWYRTPADLGPRMIDRISPVLLSIDIILAALGAMIWASDDWQVDRLFGRRSRRTKRGSFDELARRARIQRTRRDF